MKLLILIALTIASLNVFSAEELGENQKSDCPAANQSPKREAKDVGPVESEIKIEDTKGIIK